MSDKYETYEEALLRGKATFTQLPDGPDGHGLSANPSSATLSRGYSCNRQSYVNYSANPITLSPKN